MAWGRVALLLAAAEPTKIHLDEVAKLVAYKSNIAPAKEKSEQKGSIESSEKHDENLLEESVTQQFPEMIFWQITKIITLKQPDNEIPSYLLDKHKAAQFNADQKGTYVFEAPKPLATLTQLTPLLINSLGRTVKSQQLDHYKIVRSLSQGKPVKKLQYQQQSKWPPLLTILVDKYHELYPYWTDFDYLVKQLQIQLGNSHVQVITLHERTIYNFVEQKNTLHSTVLILSDLCAHKNNHRYWVWQNILETLQKQQTRILTLSNAAHSPPLDTQLRKARINSFIPAHGFVRHAKKSGFNIPIKAEQLDNALIMISPLALVDSGLFRKLRTTFKWGSPVLEGVIWNHKDVVQNVIGLRLQTSAQEHYRYKFNQLSKTTQQQFWKLVEKHHKDAYPGLLNLERTSKMALSQMSKTDHSQTIAYLQSLLAHYYQNSSEHGQNQLNAQLKTMIDFVPEKGWQSSEIMSDLLHQAYALAYQDEIRNGQWNPSLPVGCDPNKMRALTEKNRVPAQQTFSIQLSGIKGDACVYQYQQVKKTTSDILHYTASDTQPALWQSTENELQIPLKQGSILRIEKEGMLLIKTAKTQWQIKGINCPVFAQNIGQDQQGLFIETELNNPQKRYYWLPEKVDETEQKQAGVWFPDKRFADNIGHDQYGLYTDLTLKNITQRFRYIEPGVFLMGSPETELEREPWESSKETQHQVTLTEGFWLADTTVTQALYQAVMNENPSRFKGYFDHPVETVSWDNTQQFIEKLNKMIQGLKAKLPTEAQWEYACRAGTTTPFSFGDNISPEQVNYNGQYPYAEGKEGFKRENTVAVKSLPANQWGLYEMHGNVAEYCEDRFQEDLGNRPVIDPLEDKLGTFRVVRNGSFSGLGWSVRSAIRDRFRPSGLMNDIGFRLSLGLEFQAGQEHTEKTIFTQLKNLFSQEK